MFIVVCSLMRLLTRLLIRSFLTHYLGGSAGCGDRGHQYGGPRHGHIARGVLQGHRQGIQAHIRIPYLIILPSPAHTLISYCSLVINNSLLAINNRQGLTAQSNMPHHSSKPPSLPLAIASGAGEAHDVVTPNPIN